MFVADYRPDYLARVSDISFTFNGDVPAEAPLE